MFLCIILRISVCEILALKHCRDTYECQFLMYIYCMCVCVCVCNRATVPPGSVITRFKVCCFELILWDLALISFPEKREGGREGGREGRKERISRPVYRLGSNIIMNFCNYRVVAVTPVQKVNNG